MDRELAEVEFTSWFYVNRTEMAEHNAPFQIDGRRNHSLLIFFFVSRSVVWICKLQKGNHKENGKKWVNLRVFIECTGPALQKQSLVCLSGSVVRARLRCGSCEAKKAPETRTRLPAIGGGEIYSTRLWARAVTWAVPWTGWQLFWSTMSGGRKSSESWSEHLPAHGITHAKPPPERWTVSPKPPASSPAPSPDQTWLSPALCLAAIPLVPKSLLLLFINRMIFKKEA